MQKKIKERPILFSGEMVRAILAGRKTMTRRVVKPQPFERDPWHWQWLKNGKYYQLSEVYTDQQDGSALFPYGPQRLLEQCPYGMPGDRLWVRETWFHITGDAIPDHRSNLAFRADYPDCVDAKWDRPLQQAEAITWVPSIHMPRWACRDVYTVTKVRLERLQDITEPDAIAEGVEPLDGYIWKNYLTFKEPQFPLFSARDSFETLWRSLNDKKPGRAWADNPWIWVVEFMRVTV